MNINIPNCDRFACIIEKPVYQQSHLSLTPGGAIHIGYSANGDCGIIQHAYQAEWEKLLQRAQWPGEQPSPDHNPWVWGVET